MGCMLSQLPIVAAPMAGGPSTAELVIAVGRAGGLGFLAGGSCTPEVLAGGIAAVRASGVAFGVNLMVPDTVVASPTALADYADLLHPEAQALGVELGIPAVVDDGGYERKLQLLLDDPVPVVSFTFGLPEQPVVGWLHEVGTAVFASVTTAEEALTAHELGLDGFVLQGHDAGGHAAVHDPRRNPQQRLLSEMVADLRGRTSLPIIAAGGVSGPADVRALVDAGATAVAAGTMFLLADEAGTSEFHRQALIDDGFTDTVLTRAWTGRPARALVNGFVLRHTASAPTGYPEVQALTMPLRKAAAQQGNLSYGCFWAGTGWRSARSAPAGEIVAWLASELA